MFLGLLFLHPILFACYYIARPYQREETRPLMVYLRDHYRTDDGLYVSHAAFYAFSYYQSPYGLSNAALVIGPDPASWQESLTAVNSLVQHERIWLLFSHVSTSAATKERDVILGQFDTIGTRRSTLELDGASLYLYSLPSSSKSLLRNP
jgi:hypothetical protein